MLDVFLSTTVDDVNFAAQGGTECNVEGPFYVPDAQLLERPYVLPQREAEPGERLVFSGTVRSTDGSVLAGALVDVWQASAAGEYSNFHPPSEGNLRGRRRRPMPRAGSIRDIVPPPYAIPDGRRYRQLTHGLGRHLRPVNSLQGQSPRLRALTTQIYFEGDPSSTPTWSARSRTPRHRPRAQR